MNLSPENCFLGQFRPRTITLQITWATSPPENLEVFRVGVLFEEIVLGKLRGVAHVRKAARLFMYSGDTVYSIQRFLKSNVFTLSAMTKSSFSEILNSHPSCYWTCIIVLEWLFGICTELQAIWNWYFVKEIKWFWFLPEQKQKITMKLGVRETKRVKHWPSLS